MSNKTIGLVGGLVLLAVSSTSWGWSFWNREEPIENPSEATPAQASDPTRVLHKTLSEADGNTFVILVKEKKNVARDVADLNKMAEGLKRDFQTASASLQKEFNIQPAGNYNYDAGSNVIYALESVKGGTGVVTKVHFKLDTPEKINQFVGLVRAKKEIQDALLGLKAVIQYKKTQWIKLQAVLQAKFGIARDRNYEFDAKALSLYVINTPPEEQILIQDEGETSDASVTVEE